MRRALRRHIIARAELDTKKRRRADFERACRLAKKIPGDFDLRALCALACLGSAGGFSWDEIRRMLT